MSESNERPHTNDGLAAGRPSRLADIAFGALAGIPAGLAYLAAEWIDNRISGRRLFDMQLLARPFVRSTRSANILGVMIHLGNSMALGALYALVAEKRLPGPALAKSLIFVSLENTVLYPALILERFHPARKKNEIGSYWSIRSYLWTMPRHFAFGAVLGPRYARLRRPRD